MRNALGNATRHLVLKHRSLATFIAWFFLVSAPIQLAAFCFGVPRVGIGNAAWNVMIAALLFALLPAKNKA